METEGLLLRAIHSVDLYGEFVHVATSNQPSRSYRRGLQVPPFLPTKTQLDNQDDAI
jgi:hypothetical protein